MDTILAQIFTDETAEFSNIQTVPTVDLTDWPLTPNLISTFTTSSNFFISSPISEHGYFEIEFMLGSAAFWNCNMNFGNSQCGIDIRQGISHLIDKTKFVNGDPAIAGTASAIDNPLPTSNGGLPSPIPCTWDNGVVPAILQPILGTSLQESGSSCVVGTPGGLAYHLAPASGAVSPWQPSLSDKDFCAAAAHFIDAGIATGVVNNNPSTPNCTLTGVPAVVTSNPISFFVRSDNTPRLDLGDSLGQVICALFTGSYSFNPGCGINGSTNNILTVVHGPITAFPGFTTATDHIDVSWDMYTAAFGVVFPFDSSLYLGYNSRFVSGISTIRGGTPTQPCNTNSVPTASAGNYMYLCNINYDSLSHAMEFANCLTAQVGIDPTLGQTSPTFGTCSAGGSSAVSAGYQAEDAFGKSAFTIPIFQQSDQFGYLQCTETFRPCGPTNNAEWHRVINNFGSGIPNYYTWLNAWNPNPAQPGTIRQGFKQTTRNPSPYIASTVWDTYIEGNIMDSLHNVNPLNNAEDLSWMDISGFTTLSLTYIPPPGTVLSYRFTLMPNLSWQDGRPITAFDVAYSYLSMLAVGAFQSGGASVLSGVTILSPTQFDLHVSSVGPFTRLFLTGVPIFPGRYWTCGGTQPSIGVAPNIIPAPCTTGGSNWDNSIARCTNANSQCFPVQYYLGTAPSSANCYPNVAASCAPQAICVLPFAGTACPSAPLCQFCPSLMNPDLVKTGALYDPIANHILIGSGPWTCGAGTGLGQACAPGNVMNPGVGQSYTLQRNGKSATPGTAGDYFRSSAFLATYLWTGDISPGVSNFSAAKACFQVTPLTPLSSTPPGVNSCAHWQQGIGTSGATSAPGVNGCPGAPNTTPCGIPVGPNQISIVKLYININWVYPDVWNSAAPPFGIVPLDPVLYQGTGLTLSPASGSGGVGCASAYPTGGYDC